MENAWAEEFQGNASWILQFKLTRLSKVLSMWSKDSIGDVFKITMEMEAKVAICEENYDVDASNSNRILLHKSNAKYIGWLHQMGGRWRIQFQFLS